MNNENVNTNIDVNKNANENGNTNPSFKHRSVLLDECIEGLKIDPTGIYVDGTAGGGGHSFEIAKHLTTGKLIAIDRDESAIAAATNRLAPYGDRCIIVRNNFSELANVVKSLGYEKIDGVLLDLGVSSHQLDTPERGFSYMEDAPLDMRMDKRSSLSAWNVVNEYTKEQLTYILREYGEENFAYKIALKICDAREIAPINTTFELLKIIRSAMPAEGKKGGTHPGKRTFQAIRIEVNGELSVIEPTIKDAFSILKPGGRLAIITFHSLEDRIVKHVYQDQAKGCICPKGFPICVCNNKPSIEIISRKPILPSEEELNENSRSKSAKLRVAEKL